MMVGGRNNAQNLFQLVNAVRRHDARVLIEIVGQPAEHTGQKGAQSRMVSDKGNHDGEAAG